MHKLLTSQGSYSMAVMGFLHPKTLERKRLLQQSIILIFLFTSSSKSLMLMVHAGRQAPKVLSNGHEEKGLNMRFLIGSKPPRCERRCENCERCEAVQVPITPNVVRISYHQQVITNRSNNIVITYSRGDDLSNYKPICWKCKCGDFIFNP